MTDPRQHVPGVDRLLASEAFRELLEAYPRERVVREIREVLDEVRKGLAGESGGAEEGAGADPPAAAAPTFEGLAASVRTALERGDVPTLRPVVNATGVILHTNLGRAPLAEAARRAMAAAAVGYTNLEFDLDEGVRGSRYTHCVGLLTELTGAEAALVVNNAAAALVLTLNTVAAGAGVVVSRGELVEIGGGFRIPEILSRSGATLREVGTTNRTRVRDYEEALAEGGVGAILKVHRSNFRISGFTEEAPVEALAPVAREGGLPLVHDVGSGLMVEAERLGLPGEPRPHDSLAAGADVVVFSGDKLLGGPQAGVILGRGELVARMRKNPLCRALRVDKVTLAGLEATLRLYRDPEAALRDIPTLRMLTLRAPELEARCAEVAGALTAAGADARMDTGASVVGGGTFPDVTIPGPVVRVDPGAASPAAVARALRTGDPPVVGRVEEDALVLDLRTVDPSEDPVVVRRVTESLRDA